MTTDDTITLSEWWAIFKRGYRATADKYGRLWAVLMIPLYPYIAVAAMKLADAPEPADKAKIERAKARQVDDWSELKSE